MTCNLVSNPRLACTQCRLLRTVLRESREEPFQGALPNLILHFSSAFLLQDRVPVQQKNVIDAADAKTFTQESEFCLRVLAQLNTLVPSSNDVCFGLEVVRDEPTGPHRNSECVASNGRCEDRDQLSHFVDFPLRRGCGQVCNVVDYVCFLRIPLYSHFVVGMIKFLQVGRHQDRVAEDVAIVHLPDLHSLAAHVVGGQLR